MAVLENDFLIDALRNHRNAKARLQELVDAGEPLAVTPGNAAEVLRGARRRGGKDVDTAVQFLRGFAVVEFDLPAAVAAGRVAVEADAEGRAMGVARRDDRRHRQMQATLRHPGRPIQGSVKGCGRLGHPRPGAMAVYAVFAAVMLAGVGLPTGGSSCADVAIPIPDLGVGRTPTGTGCIDGSGAVISRAVECQRQAIPPLDRVACSTAGVSCSAGAMRVACDLGLATLAVG